MRATKFLSEMQAHFIFELAQSHFCIEMVLLSYFLHKISQDCCLPSLREAGELGEGRDSWESTDDPGKVPGAARRPVPSGERSRAAVTFGVLWPSSASGQGEWHHCVTFPRGKLSPTAYLWKSLVFRLGEEGNFTLYLC